MNLLRKILTVVTVSMIVMGMAVHAEHEDDLWHKLPLKDLLITALCNRADLYVSMFNYGDAINDITAAIALQPENPDLYTQRGQMIMLLYEWDRAIADYDYAIELDNQFAPAYFHRAVAHYSIGERVDREQILTDFDRYLELAPTGVYAQQAEAYIHSIELEIQALGE